MSSRFVSRLRFLATISLANVVVIYTTVFNEWTLREAGLAYAGEWLILMLVVYARVLIARRLPGESDSGGRRWPLLYARAMAILVTLLMNGLFIGLMTLLLLGGFDFSLLPDSTWRALGWCWLAFLIAHAIGFVEFARQGAYDELIDDNRVMANLWRYPAMLPAAVAVTGERSHDAPVVPWFFVCPGSHGRRGRRHLRRRDGRHGRRAQKGPRATGRTCVTAHPYRVAGGGRGWYKGGPFGGRNAAVR